MSTIDVATGLPELPEGHRWFVFEGYSYQLGYLRGTPDGTIRIRIETTEAVSKTTGRWPFKKTVTTNRWVAVYAAPSEEIQGRHPIAVKNAASREQNKQQQALLGAYPPNRLETSA